MSRIFRIHPRLLVLTAFWWQILLLPAILAGLPGDAEVPPADQLVWKWEPAAKDSLQGWDVAGNVSAGDARAALIVSAQRDGPAGSRWRLQRRVRLSAGQMLLARVRASSAVQPAEIRALWSPVDARYPGGSEQTFVVLPLSKKITAAFVAAAAGDYVFELSGEQPLAVTSMELVTRSPPWLRENGASALHAGGSSEKLPAHWSNVGGRYLQGQGGTVVFVLTPSWFEALGGAPGGIFDAYLTLRMTADRRVWTTYFMVQPPGTTAENVAWECARFRLDQSLTIGDPPDAGWLPPSRRFDDGHPHFLAFRWRQFAEEGSGNFLYTSYFVDGRVWNARVTFLGEQTVAPDPASVFLGSVGGQPTGYDASPPAR